MVQTSLTLYFIDIFRLSTKHQGMHACLGAIAFSVIYARYNLNTET